MGVLCLPLAPTVQGATVRITAAQQAAAAMQQLEGDFYDARVGLYQVAGGQHEPFAALWPTSQVLAAAIAVARITQAPADLARVRRIIASLQHFATPTGAYHARVVPSLRYYDDNNWIALDLLDAYDLLHDPSYLQAAERDFAFLVGGWDGTHGGGVLWADGHADRPTVSTAPIVEIGLRLAALTQQAAYRDWAQRCYNWENTAMRAPNGLYWDHLDAAGHMDRDIVSYNQGVMIEANLALAQTGASAHYLGEAARIAAAAAAALPGPWRDHGRYAAFDAIYFAALAHLDRRLPRSASLAPVEDYVAWAWPAAHLPRAARDEGALLEQAAFVISAALLAG